ncbi:MAG: PilZ domain-containing protein [Nitrospirales bacterium]|nr:hypothetical protein [Nitrospirales bacterium]
MSGTTHLPLGSNLIWLTLAVCPDPVLIQAQLLGLGPDHSLLCGLQPPLAMDNLTTGLPCKGRSFIDGDIFEFESAIQAVHQNPFTLRLEAPTKISKHQPRSLPRLLVNLSGTVRPMSDTGHIAAVLPITFVNLSPTGCQFQVPISAWPLISSLNVQLSCRLPGLFHYTQLHGIIEWVQPLQDLTMGIRFVFNVEHSGGRQDLHRWFTSQKAHLINTTA